MKEEFGDTKGVIRIRKSKKNRQHNGQMKKYKKNKQRSITHTHKTKDRVPRTLLNTGGELRYSGRVGSSCTTSGTSRVNLVTKIMLFFNNVNLNVSITGLYAVCLNHIFDYVHNF